MIEDLVADVADSIESLIIARMGYREAVKQGPEYWERQEYELQRCYEIGSELQERLYNLVMKG